VREKREKELFNNGEKQGENFIEEAVDKRKSSSRVRKVKSVQRQAGLGLYGGSNR